MTDEKGIVPTSGQIVRQDMGGQQLEVRAETAAAAVAAQSQAVVQARYIMAMRNPRDLDDVRTKLLKECERPGFAHVARYKKPIGRGIVGFSIRFAEAAARCMKNIESFPQILWEDDHRRIVRFTVTDLESNLTYSRDVTIDKTVERRSLKDEQVALSVRTNSQGQPTYLVAATEDDVSQKQGIAESKSIRNSILRLVPGDILDECETKVAETIANKAAKDPDGERKNIADVFSRLGVMPSHLKQYLGHDLAGSTPAELVHLREVWSTLKSGEASWADIMDSKHGKSENGEKNGLSGVTDRLKAETEAGKKAGADDARWARLLGRIKELTGDDEDAYRQLLGEVSGVYVKAGKGVEGCLASEKFIIEHPVFGNVPPPHPSTTTDTRTPATDKTKGAKKRAARKPLEE